MLSGEDGLEGQQQPAQGNALSIILRPIYAPQKNWLSSSGKTLLPF